MRVSLTAPAQEMWPLSKENPNSLNVSANWGRFLLFQGKYAAALAKLDEAVDLAGKWQVNPDAIAAMHHYRACALHELGRGNEAGVSIAIAASAQFPVSVAQLHLCTGDAGAARRVLQQALEADSSRGSVLMWAQKSTYRPLPSNWDRKMLVKIEELRADPCLRKEVEKFGRILPYALNEGAGREMTP